MSIRPSHRLLIEIPSAQTAAPALETVSRPGTGPTAWAAVPRLPGPAVHPWDDAQQAVRHPASVGLESVAAPAYAEPDFVQSFPLPGPDSGGLESFTGSPCEDRTPDDFWPIGDPAFGWHLDEGHSSLKAARDRVGDPGDGRRVRICILETGNDPAHATLPFRLLTELQRNFADGDPNDATDPGRHFSGNNPGHATATLALLAERRVAIPDTTFDDYVGGAPFADIVPVRIANSVIHFYTSAMAKVIEYAIDAGYQVVSISMGGLPARSWAAVNRAYEAGVAIFAAAGNRFRPSPPFSTVYPARFNRVVAVCGVTADGRLHTTSLDCIGTCRGVSVPPKMATALASYAPNTPWALMGCGGVIGFGAGTSAASPQTAAAAARQGTAGGKHFGCIKLREHVHATTADSRACPAESADGVYVSEPSR
jgi:hypothetical protein